MQEKKNIKDMIYKNFNYFGKALFFKKQSVKVRYSTLKKKKKYIHLNTFITKTLPYMIIHDHTSPYITLLLFFQN